MTGSKVVFYDFGHCNSFMKERGSELSQGKTGLAALAPYRPLFSAFADEALTTNAITLGQFDTGLVYMFVPEDLSRALAPSQHKVARAKAVELMQCSQPPMIFEIRAAQEMKPPIAEPARPDKWMPPDLLEIVNNGSLEIHLLINAHAFFADIIMPALAHNGFESPDDYLTSGRSGFIHVRHADAPGQGYKLPWVKWLREMLTGGYSMAYPMACMGTYLQKMQEAIAASKS